MTKTIHIHVHDGKTRDASTANDINVGIEMIKNKLSGARLPSKPSASDLDSARSALIAAKNDIDGLLVSIRGITAK